MTAAGLKIEDAKGECNYGQHEINVKFDEALRSADGHSVYKNGAKEIASQMGYALSFMPKFNELEGNSCHVHLSLQSQDGEAVFPGDSGNGSHGFSELFPKLPGRTDRLYERDDALFAPNINSYKRFAKGTFAPTAVAWGTDTGPARCGSSGMASRSGSRTGRRAGT